MNGQEDLDRLVRLWRAMYGERACDEARKRASGQDGGESHWSNFVARLCDYV